MNLLHLDSSVLGGNSVSRALSAAVVARLRAAHPGLAETYRDLAAEPLPHLSGAYLAKSERGFNFNLGGNGPFAPEIEASTCRSG